MEPKPTKLTCRAGSMRGWYVIERAEHDGRMWLEPIDGGFSFQTSARISDADVEGYGYEMRAIALAIKDRTRFEARRCAVRVEGDRVYFWSPRNSQREGVVPLADADALAVEIWSTIPEYP